MNTRKRLFNSLDVCHMPRATWDCVYNPPNSIQLVSWELLPWWWRMLTVNLYRFLGCSRFYWGGHLQRQGRWAMLLSGHELSHEFQRRSSSFFPFFLQSGKNRIIKGSSSTKLVDLECGPFSQNSLAFHLHIPALESLPFAGCLGMEGQRGKMLNLWFWWPFWEPLPKLPWNEWRWRGKENLRRP